MTDDPGSSYDGVARAYAAGVDSQPWNAHYERPAMFLMLPPLAGRNVLDAGCGSGWYAEELLAHGAQVTSFDRNPDFVALTQTRVGERARVLQADLAEPFTFAGSEEFDVVVCPLALHYLLDWRGALAEFHRVLKPEGVLVFSTHHPTMDWKQFERLDYFATELLEDEWELGTMRFYRRPLTAMSEVLEEAGFLIERLLEPQPTEAFREANPKGHERLMREPWFLVVRAIKRAVPIPA
ncbi:MAG: class I SAM-dependent methyltransferase [Candidatus Eisenbacteria bacterium]